MRECILDEVREKKFNFELQFEQKSKAEGEIGRNSPSYIILREREKSRCKKILLSDRIFLVTFGFIKAVFF